MRKKLTLILLSLLFINISCNSLKKIEKVVVTGVIEAYSINENIGYSITELPSSRSKVCNYINKESSDKASYKELENRVGEVVTAEVSIIEDKGFWDKEVSLINIQ